MGLRRLLLLIATAFGVLWFAVEGTSALGLLICLFNNRAVSNMLIRCVLDLSFQLFRLASPLTVPLLASLLFGSILAPLFACLRRLSRRKKAEWRWQEACWTICDRSQLLHRALLVSLLGILVVETLLLTLVGADLVAVDDSYYVGRLEEMADPIAARNVLISNPHRVYLLILYLLRGALGLPLILTVKLGAVLLVPFLSGCVYLFVASGTNSRSLAILSSIFSAISVQVSVGLMSGIYSNWLAFALLHAFYCVLTKALKRLSTKLILSIFLLSLLIMLTHVWTWWVVMGSLALNQLISLICSLGEHDSSRADPVVGRTLLCVLVSAIPMLVILGAGGLELYLVPNGILSFLAVENCLRIAETLAEVLKLYVRGFLIVPAVYFLSLLSLLSFHKVRSIFGRVLGSWIGSVSAFALFAWPWYEWRVLYLFPFHVASAVGTVTVLGVFDRYFGLRDEYARYVKALFLGALILMLLNYLLRCIGALLGFPI